MRILSDRVLIECYLDSLEMELDHDFIEMLCKEMKERNLNIPCVTSNSSSCTDEAAHFHRNN